MTIFDQISMCVRNLLRRKTRTLLTVSGVVIGTASIVVMLSFGVAMKATIDDMLESMGSLSIINVENRSYGQKNAKTLNDAALQEMKQIPNVTLAAPKITNPDFKTPVGMVAGKKNRYVSNWINIIGLDAEAIKTLDYKLSDGHVYTGKEKGFPILIGSNTPYDFEDSKKKKNNMVSSWDVDPVTGLPPKAFFNPMKSDMFFQISEQIENQKEPKKHYVEADVVGVLAKDDMNWENSYSIFMPIEKLDLFRTEVAKLSNTKIDLKKEKKNGYRSVIIKVSDNNQVESVESAIKAMGFDTYSMNDMRKSMMSSVNMIQAILGALGAISLFIAALSITNTMVMSIYERTREIGVMKVLGCVLGDIRSVFLMEAGCIGFFGGVVGIILSYGVSFAINSAAAALGFGGMMGPVSADAAPAALSTIPLWLVVVAILFSILIGLIAGLVPANRAVKISALEAIKQ